MWGDPILAEPRRIREEYAARFDYDVEAILRHPREAEQTDTGPNGAPPSFARPEDEAAALPAAETTCVAGTRR